MALNKKQRRVYEWLNDALSLPVFADAYRGAVILLNQKPSGYVSFVAHTGRDIMNGLATAANGLKRAQVQYVELINNIQDDWKSEWGFRVDLSQGEIEEGHLIPHEVCQKISTLIREHKFGRERKLEADGLFFSTFLDYSDKEKIPNNFLSEWKAAKDWFLGHVHLREKSFRDETDDNLVKHFNCLDGYLYIAASSQYERLRALNEILDATNR